MTKSTVRRSGGRKAASPDTLHIKIAISLPGAQVAAAQRAVREGRAPSVSAYISRALEEHDGAGSLSELVALLRAEDGPPSAADYAWADSVLAVMPSPRRRTSEGGR